MFVPLQDNGIISEFEGYERLKEFPRRKDGFIDLERLPQVLKEEAGLPNEYQVSKQPDVLMLFYLFSSEELKELFDRLHYDFRPESIPENIHFYVRQTASDSSLSRVALAWVLSRMDRPGAWKHLHALSATGAPSKKSVEIGVFPRSWDLLEEALGTDFFDIQGGTTADGLHMGAMVGTVDIVQRCYTGIVIKNDVLWLNPCLPEELTRLSFHLLYRQQALQFEITQQTVKVSVGHSDAAPIKIGFKHRTYELAPGVSRAFQVATGDPCE
jgi:alpha,alpha-trehalase